MPLISIYSDTLYKLPIAEKIIRIIQASLASVDPINAVTHCVKVNEGYLYIGDQYYQLDQIDNIIVIGFGKASQKMAKGLIMLLKGLCMKGIVICKHSEPELEIDLLPEVKTLIGDHPIPNINSIKSSKAIINLLKNRRPKDLVICLISGGGSSLFTNLEDGLTLKALQKLTETMLQCGASIQKINTVRKHLDNVKGGGLVKLVYPNPLITLVLSDVIGDDLSMIASGPTAADPACFDDALKVIQKYHLGKKIDIQIMNRLKAGKAGEIEETLKPGDYRMKNVQNLIIGNNRRATLAGKFQAIKEGFYSEVISNHLCGEAREVGSHLGQIIKKINAKNGLKYPLCLIAGGESTVTIRGKGKGGRNLEVALAAALEMNGVERVCLVTLATDGEDGVTDAAGAVVTGSTIKIAESNVINPILFLNQNNSYEFFKRVGGIITTGSTGTNVNDLCFLFTY